MIQMKTDPEQTALGYACGLYATQKHYGKNNFVLLSDSALAEVVKFLVSESNYDPTLSFPGGSYASSDSLLNYACQWSSLELIKALIY